MPTRQNLLWSRFGIILLVVTFLFLSFCDQAKERRNVKILEVGNKNYMEIIESDSTLICWDSIVFNESPCTYEMLYRSQYDSKWFPLKSNIPASEKPCVVVYRNEITSNDSILYLSVRAVAEGNKKSDLHLSTDSTSFPSVGWFLFWKNRK